MSEATNESVTYVEQDAWSLANEIISYAEWFDGLGDAFKDELSLPNYDHHQALAAVRLARLFLAERAAAGEVPHAQP